jgi:hypothetical protein
MSPSRIAGVVILALLAVQVLAEHFMGRVWICSCGTIRLWVGDIWSPELSQQLFDWYTAYRKQALAAGYTGDSILNSVMDNVSMMTGFALARLLPWKATVALVLALEIGAAALVHDNLTLNILNFIHRFPAIEAWQSRAQK